MEITKEYLQREYIEKGRTALSIMEETGITQSTLTRRMKKFGLIKRKITPTYNINPDWLREQYLIKLRAVEDIAEEVGCSGHLIKELCSVNNFYRDNKYRQTDEGRAKHSRVRSEEECKKQGDALLKLEDGYTRRRMGSRRQYIHRAIVEETLGRLLGPNEVVHHIDQDKTNHHPSNLLVLTRVTHQILHLTMRIKPGLDQISFLNDNNFKYEVLPEERYHLSDTFRKWIEQVRCR